MAGSELRVSPGGPWFSKAERGEPFDITVDGETVEAYPGETVATVLTACGKRVFSRTDDGAPRGLFCAMGLCFGCLVTVDGVPDVRACRTTVEPGMCVETSATAESGK
jgi:predicted molibdopterin-dependent oxidoreductase YjgC